MTASVSIEYHEDSEDLCYQTVTNPSSGNLVSGFGPGPCMTRWLEEHGGRYRCSTVFDAQYSFYPEALEIEFQDSACALLFKLTWG